MGKNEEQKSQLQIETPEGKRRIWVSIPIKNSEKYNHEFSDFWTSLMSIRRANPREEGRNEE
jgi:hypothetical protein